MRFRTLSWTAPPVAAGAGFTITPSQNERVKLESLRFTFTTSAAIANRLVWAVLMDPTNTIVYETGSATALAATASSDFVISPTFGTVVAMQGKTQAAVGLPWRDFWMPPAWSIQVGALAEDVADQFSGITYAAEYGEDIWDQEQDLAALAAFVQSLA